VAGRGARAEKTSGCAGGSKVAEMGSILTPWFGAVGSINAGSLLILYS
jgi:hypothetical protein